jgi:hypothetical protein
MSVEADRTAEALDLAAGAGVPAAVIGRVGGSRIRMKIGGSPVIDETLDEAQHLWSDAIGHYFESQRAIA